jgi:hypothetical protein
MTSPSETTMDHQMAADDEDTQMATDYDDTQMAADDEDTLGRAPVLAGPPLTEDPQPAFPAMAWDPDATAMPSPAAEPEAVSEGDQDQPVILSAPEADPDPEPVPDVPDPSAAIVADAMGMRWREIQAMFVDDPRSSAEQAASLVDESVQELVASVREQQDSLLAAWHDQDTVTEDLRTVVQHYRAFGTRLADFYREG